MIQGDIESIQSLAIVSGRIELGSQIIEIMPCILSYANRAEQRKA
jgi:hypothetical protein